MHDSDGIVAFLEILDLLGVSLGGQLPAVKNNRNSDVDSLPSAGARGGLEFSNRWQQIEFCLAALVAFLAPMNFLRYPGFYVTLGDVFAVLCLLAMIASKSLPVRPLGAVTPLWMAAAVLLIGGLLVSSLYFGDPWRGLVISGQYFFCLFVLPLVLAWRPLPQVYLLVKVFVFSIVVVCLHGVYVMDIVGQTNTRFVSGSGRLMSLVERENEAAGLFALTVPLLLWLRTQGKVSLPYFWPALCLIAYGIMLTGSNSGIIALAFILATHFAANFSWKQIMAAAGAVTILSLAIIYEGTELLPAVFQKRVLDPLTNGGIEETGSFVDRVGLIKQALGVISNHVLLGIGADQFQIISYWRAPVHNFYLLIWVEGGFIAFVGYLLILASGLLAGIMAFRSAGKFHSANCTFTIFVTFALLSNVYTHIYARFYFVLVLLAISVSLSAMSASKSGLVDPIQRHQTRGHRRLSFGRH